jgi:hypothetical protein
MSSHWYEFSAGSRGQQQPPSAQWQGGTTYSAPLGFRLWMTTLNASHGVYGAT